VAEYGQDLVPGVRYRFPLDVHCGMDHVGEFNGTNWYLQPARGLLQDPPAHWPIAQGTIFGYVTLVDGDTIEYSIGQGEVIGSYAPETREPQACA
jgi:hypothetical protein